MNNPILKSSKYLVCIDNTDVSRIALRFACIKGKRRNILIDMLHVIPPSDIQTIGAVASKIEKDQRDEAEALLQDMAKEAFELSGIRPSLWIRQGNPADEIIAQTLEDYDANMLVLGVTPGTKSGKRVIQSLTSQAGDKLLIPMMLVPGNLTDKQMEALA
jgi:nucleotide-binding universal stress UspA family protein